MAKHLLPMDASIARYLNEGREGAGLTYRQIAAATGMSINRIGIILRQEPPPATLGEVGLIAATFGTTASALVARAEAEQHRIIEDVVAADQDGEATDWALAADKHVDETAGEFEDGEAGDGI